MRGLAFIDVTKGFGDVRALDAVTFTVPPGHVVGFLGPNGAGKTTAMRSIFGLVELDAGAVRWNGEPIATADRLRFGYMPEQRGLYPRMRLAEQLTFLATLHGLDRATAQARVATWLQRLSLGDRSAAKVDELSHGNQQRAQLAAALIHEPDLLVLDEPFAGLDPLAVHTLAGVLRAEAARGAAVLFSSHQLELVEDVCDDVVIIDRGRLVASGRLDDLRSASGHRRIDLRVEDAPSDWSPPVDGVRVAGRRDGDLRLLADSDVDPEAVLAAAGRAGHVAEFHYGPPSLGDLFVDLVRR